MRIFALCRAGRVDEAPWLASEQLPRLGSGGPMKDYWPWLEARFGIDPRPSS